MYFILFLFLLNWMMCDASWRLTIILSAQTQCYQHECVPSFKSILKKLLYYTHHIYERKQQAVLTQYIFVFHMISFYYAIWMGLGVHLIRTRAVHASAVRAYYSSLFFSFLRNAIHFHLVCLLLLLRYRLPEMTGDSKSVNAFYCLGFNLPMNDCFFELSFFCFVCLLKLIIKSEYWYGKIAIIIMDSVFHRKLPFLTAKTFASNLFPGIFPLTQFNCFSRKYLYSYYNLSWVKLAILINKAKQPSDNISLVILQSIGRTQCCINSRVALWNVHRICQENNSFHRLSTSQSVHFPKRTCLPYYQAAIISPAAASTSISLSWEWKNKKSKNA